MTARQTGVVLGAVILVAGLLALWLVPLFNGKAEYERAQNQLEADLGGPFAVRPIDEDLQKTLGVIESTWQDSSKGLPSPHDAALRLVGFDPTVEGLIELYNYRIPEFSWLEMSRNQKNVRIAVIQATVLSMSVDRTIYVSADRRVALLRVLEGVVVIFRENQNGLSETRWTRPGKNVVQDAAADAREPCR